MDWERIIGDLIELGCAAFCMAFIFAVWFLVQWLLWF